MFARYAEPGKSRLRFLWPFCDKRPEKGAGKAPSLIFIPFTVAGLKVFAKLKCLFMAVSNEEVTKE